MQFSKPASIYATACSLFFLLIPLNFYALNPHELKFKLIDFLPIILVVWALLLLAGFAFIYLTRKMWPKFYTFFTCLTWVMWLQGTVFQWNYGILSEGGLQSNHHRGLIEVCAYVLLIWLILKASKKKLDIANTFLSILVVCSLAWALYQSSVVSNTKNYEFVADSTPKFSFSSEKNILVILIDEAQSNIYEEVIFQDPNLAAEYSDFTLFRNSISNTNFTGHSVPMILTGKFYDNSEPYSEVLRRYATESIPRDMLSLNYETDLYFYASGTQWYHPSFASNSRQRDSYTFEYALSLIDAALFKCSNHWLKPIIYNHGRWFLSSRTLWIMIVDQALLGNDGTNNGQRTAPKPPHTQGDQDTDFVVDLEERGRVDTAANKFKFFHLRGSHLPFNMDENGQKKDHDHEGYRHIVTYKAKLLPRLFKKLKDLGVYEESTIIILSDHGSGRTESTRVFEGPNLKRSVEWRVALARANTLLLVKHGQEVAQKNTDKPFQLTQLRALIDSLANGGTLNDYISELPDRAIRRFFSYHYRDLQPYVENYEEYIVVKPIWNPSAFIEYHNHIPAYEDGNCLFDQLNFDTDYGYWGQVSLGGDVAKQISIKIPPYSSFAGELANGDAILFAKVIGLKETDVNLIISSPSLSETTKHVVITPENSFLEINFESATHLFGDQLSITSDVPVNIEKIHIFLQTN